MAFLKFSQLKKYRKKKKRFQRSLPIPVPKIASTNVTCIWVQAFSKVSDPRKSIYCRESITNWVGEGVWLRLLEFDETPSRTLPHFVCRPWQQRKSKSVPWTRWRACLLTKVGEGWRGRVGGGWAEPRCWLGNGFYAHTPSVHRLDSLSCGQIWPSACFCAAGEVRMVFKFLND